MDTLNHHLTSTHTNRYGSTFSAIVLTGLFAGMLDAGASVMVYEIRPSRLFQFIASGVFGKDAVVGGGLFMSLWGLIIHFVLAFAWTYLYFIAYPKIKILAKHKILNGFIYGGLIWVIMNQVIIPFSRAAEGPLTLTQDVVSMLIVMIAAGLPITMLTHRYYSSENSETLTL